MQEFRLDPAAFPAFRTQLIIQVLFRFLILYGALAVFAYAIMGLESLKRMGVFYSVIAVATIVYSIYLAVRRNLEAWKTFSVSVDENGTITRRTAGLADLTLTADQITRIEESSGQGVSVRTQDASRFIFASIHLRDYNTFLARLRELRPVAVKEVQIRSPFSLLLLLGVLAGILVPMYFALASKDSRYALAGCVVVIGILLYCRSKILADPNVDERVKKSMWAMYLILFSMLLNAGFHVYKLFA